MAAISAVNPGLTKPGAKTRRLNTLDALTVLRNITDGAETDTAAEAGVQLNVEALKAAAIFINSNGVDGTVDGSNNFTVSIEVADNSGFTNATQVFSQLLPAEAAEYYVAIDGYMLETIRTAGEDESTWIRSTATKAGTTATAVTYGAHLVPC